VIFRTEKTMKRPVNIPRQRTLLGCFALLISLGSATGCSSCGEDHGSGSGAGQENTAASGSAAPLGSTRRIQIQHVNPTLRMMTAGDASVDADSPTPQP
jgi:hypothetical protein